MNIDLGHIANILLGAIGIATLTGIVGMVLWYIKVKPEVEYIKSDLAKKAEASELARVTADFERKKEDAHRITVEIDKKQDINVCDLLRKGCFPILSQKIDQMENKIDDLKEGQSQIWTRIDGWMKKNGN